MNTQYLTEIAYPASLEEVYSVLVKMRQGLDNYKLKDNANQKWIEERENMIVKILQFIDISSTTFKSLNSDYEKSFNEGFSKGRIRANNEFQRKIDFGYLNTSHSNYKEKMRAASIFNAYQKWNL